MLGDSMEEEKEIVFNELKNTDGPAFAEDFCETYTPAKTKAILEDLLNEGVVMFAADGWNITETESAYGLHVTEEDYIN